MKKTSVMKMALAGLLAVCLSHTAISQNVGIGTTTPHTSAAVEINSTTGGVLVPRMTTAHRGQNYRLVRQAGALPAMAAPIPRSS